MSSLPCDPLVWLKQLRAGARSRRDEARLRDHLVGVLADSASTPSSDFPTGALESSPELVEWTRRLLGSSRASARTSAMRTLQRLAHAPRIGAAWLPLASSPGTVCRLHVGWRRPSALSLGDSFKAAVRDGLSAALALVSRSHRIPSAKSPPGLDSAEFWLESLEPLNGRDCDGSSVGLAALAAWTSWLLGRPLPVDLVWTGRLEGHHGWQIAGVQAETLPAKAEAIQRLLPGATLMVSRGNEGDAALASIRHRALPGMDEPDPLIALLGVDLDKACAAPWQFLATQSAPPPSSMQAVILQVVRASRGGISVNDLEKAVRWIHQNGQTDVGGFATLKPDLDALIETGRLSRSGETELDLEPTGPGVDGHLEPGLAAEAHFALAAQPDLPVDQWLHHQLMANAIRPDRAHWEGLPANVAGYLTTHARVTLQALFDESARHGTHTVIQLLPRTGDSPNHLVARLMLRALQAPAPVQAVAPTLVTDDPVEQLLGVQALLEVCLHLIQAVAAEVGAIPGSDEQKRHDATQKMLDRPSIGILAKWSGSLRQLNGPANELPQPARVLAESLARWSKRQQTQAVNGLSALHAPCNIALLAREDAAHQATQVLAKVGNSVEALLTAMSEASNRGLHVHAVAEPKSMARLTLEGHRPLELPNLRVDRATSTSRARWFFHRGCIRGEPRAWTYESAVRLPDWPVPMLALQVLKPAALPVPLALVAVALRRHQPAKTSPLACLAAVDLALGVLLRIAVLPVFIAAHSKPAPADKATANLEAQGNHRSLLQALLRSKDTDRSSLGHRFRERDSLDQLAWVVDRIERLQHAPGPVSEWTSNVNDLHALVCGLIQESSMSADSFRVNQQVLQGPKPPPDGAWSWSCENGPELDIRPVMRHHPSGLELLLQCRNRRPRWRLLQRDGSL